MRQCGTIISIDGDRAKVLLQKHAACGDCRGCRWGDDDMSIEVEAINSANAQVGDLVEVDMEHQNVLTAVAIAYAFPLLALIAGVFIGNAVLGRIGLESYREVGSGILGLILTAISYLIIRSRENSLKTNQKFIPVITQISKKA